MKKIIFTCIVLSIFIFTGCQGMQIKETNHNMALAYGIGNAMGYTLKSLEIKQKVSKELNERLALEWNILINRNTPGDMVSSQELIAFYNRCLMLISRYKGDQFGLTTKLSVIFVIYSGQFDPETKNMVSINPMPMSVLQFFELGYNDGIITAENTAK